MGLKAEFPEPETTGIWPENLYAFNVFYSLRTQWNVGMAGVIGLRNESLEFALRMERVPQPDWPDVVTAVQVMEAETLRLWRAASN